GEGVEGHRGLVEEDLALPGHGQRDRSRRRHRRGLTAGEVHGQRVEILERERGEHEGREQEEHHVDHRDDLDASPATLASRAELHGAPPFSSRRIESTTRVPSCSISSMTSARRWEKELKANRAISAMKSPTAVAISASATPPVTPRGSTRPSAPKRWNARIMPVMVPSKPSSGAA